MSLDLAYDPGQEAIRDALDQFCADRCDEATVKSLTGHFPTELWSQLCELGVLEPATPEGEGGALELAAAMEALGRWVVPGPWPGSVLAARVLGGPDTASVVAGERIVSVGAPPWMPWPSRADLFLEIDISSQPARIFGARLRGSVEEVATLGGESWGRCQLERQAEVDDATAGLVLRDIAHAAYLAAAGERLLEAAAEHARTRVQFGRAIGEFQAVAHPLADCSMRLAAAATLARSAAWHFDEGDLDAAVPAAAAARLSSDGAGLETSYVCHQIFGAIGITLEGPAYHITRRIRQLASEPPGAPFARAAVLDAIHMPPLTAGGAS